MLDGVVGVQVHHAPRPPRLLHLPLRPPPCPRRSRGRDGLQEDYANTRTNPLFDSAASPSAFPSPPPGTATSAGGADVPRRERGREPLKGGRRGGGGRARSVSVAPQRRNAATVSSADSADPVGGRRASRARSVADDARPCRGSEGCGKEIAVMEESAFDFRDSHKVKPSQSLGKHKGIDASCSSQGSTTGVGCRQMDETTHSEPSTAVSPPGHHLEHAIWQQNHPTVPVDLVLEIPPEFDPDSADAAKQHWEQMDIPLEFDTDASELVSDTWHHGHGVNQQPGQLEAPLEFGPDTTELAPGITEYTIKLKQSHERAQKLRADLAVEEQREQELSRMLKDISSIDRLKVSSHLAEEKMNYFEECVSISTMDSTDFSSPEDPQPNSIVNFQPKSNTRFFHKGVSSFQEPHTPADQHGHHETFTTDEKAQTVWRDFLMWPVMFRMVKACS
ncbi:hypothetical protein BAE44_0014525 [Dichanthelium oligosanthes]|uniref:Uncharacterized protein n=1 Tax=Dichanthelium oligosanthes TaxID=888268 RepID=A0A1E5VH59_9POAL|nr:hypothetical protein BAE44_0014525 [Dichanthelium oligosanthes]